MFELAEAVLKRIAETSFTLPVKFIAFIGYAAYGYSLTMHAEENNLSWLILPSAIAVITIQFFLSRQIGHATKDERGSVSGWIGWSMLATIPPITCLLIVVLPVGGGWDTIATEFSLPETLAIVVGSGLAMSMSALSVGRAIKAGGLSPGSMASYFRRHFLTIFLASVSLLLIPQFLSDLFFFNLLIEDPSAPIIIICNILGGLLMLVTQVLAVAISAQIYRSAEAEATVKVES
ncbi:MAG: hypothetical protein V3V15_09250 [Sphingorhabdus sp.]